MEVITLELNQWYYLNGSPCYRNEIINLLKSNGWEVFELPPSTIPVCIRLTKGVKGKKLGWRSTYNPSYLPNCITLGCKELLEQLKQFYNKQEENMSGSLNQPECHHYNKILSMSYNKKRQELEDDYNNTVDAIYKDNVYMAAISNAIAKVNKATGLELRIDGTWCNYNTLLLPSDKLMLNKAQEAHQKALTKLNSEFEVAETLLDMADTFQEQMAILEKYAKDVL